jgi:hypothetical protein
MKAMKKVIILFMTLFVPLILDAQDIDYAEYFIDTDPGYGAATSITISASGTVVSLDFDANMAPVSAGMHYLVIRARDNLGRWSQGAKAVLYKVSDLDVIEGNIAQAEYFIDIDPGFGNATSIPVSTPGNDLTLTLSPEIQALGPGIHYIQFRAMDLNGRWGTGANAIFVVVKLQSSAESDIQQVEYFIDTDPGYGMGTPVTLSSVGNDLTIDFTASLSGLDDGNHVLYIRAKNDLNRWGQVYAEGFTYSSTGIGDEEIYSLFKIYPNPSSGMIQIELSDQAQDEFLIKLMDMNGKLVYETESYDKKCELDLALPGGIYLLTIETSKNSITQKLIIQ